MRAIVIVLTGIVVAVLAVRLVRSARRYPTAAVFTLLWLAATGWNLQTGLAHGYPLREELPIHAAIFLLPVAVAWLLARMRRSE